MPFKCDLALQNIPLSKQHFKTQSEIENEDVTWNPQYNPPITRTNKRRAVSLQEVEFDGCFLILHTVLETCTVQFMHKFNMSLIFYFYILRLTSWVWTDPFNWIAEIWEPFKMKLIWGLQSWTLKGRLHSRYALIIPPLHGFYLGTNGTLWYKFLYTRYLTGTEREEQPTDRPPAS